MERQQEGLTVGQNILTDVLTSSALECGLLQVVVREHGWKDVTQGSLSLSRPGALWKAFLPGGGTALIASTEGLLSADLPTSPFVLKLGVDAY